MDFRQYFRVSRGLLLVLGFGLCVLGGCEERVVRSGWESYGGAPAGAASPGNHRPEPRSASRGKSSAASSGEDWSVNLQNFEGQDHAAAAQRRRLELQSASGLSNLWVFDQGWRSQLFFGHYRGPGDPAGEKDLDLWRGLRQRGTVAIPLPILVPAPLPGSNRNYDLLFVGPDAAYTYQLGHYDAQFGKDFRKAAEKAVETLRRDGVEAFYYHGIERSSVTVGLFPRDVVESRPGPSGLVQTRIKDPRVIELQKKFPVYFVNGLGQQITRSGPGGASQSAPVPTGLGEIPR